MTVLDAFAVLALLKDEPAAGQVEQLLRSDLSCTLTALGVAEVLDHLVRQMGVDEDEAVLDLAQLGLGTPVPVDGDLGARGGLLRARRYHRQHCSISLADCVAAEAARASGAPVATSDPHLLDMCALESIPHLPLPDARGNLWTRHWS